MGPRQLAVATLLCGTAALAIWGVAGLAGFASPDFENTTRLVVENRPAKSIASPLATAMQEHGVSASEAATDQTEPAVVAAALPVAPVAIEIALADTLAVLPPEAPPVQMATANTSEAKEPVSRIETLDECPVPEICIDQYLWSLYERAPKVDARKVLEQIRVTENKNGKTRTITKKITKYIDEDFTWKDPKAAAKAGMSLKDYVIGGMDRSFKVKLYHALRALDDAGLGPGITSGFRDDYRQSIASGLKASSNSSYHGGSLRGGYGHGLAADVVSVKGETRVPSNSAASEDLWKWIDVHGKDFGVGRPYLDKDPAHLAPIDGKEYAAKRGKATSQLAGSEAKKSHRVSVRDLPGTTNRARLSKAAAHD